MIKGIVLFVVGMVSIFVVVLLVVILPLHTLIGSSLNGLLDYAMVLTPVIVGLMALFMPVIYEWLDAVDALMISND